MTNKNLLDAIGRIDPALIADAAPDVPHKKGTNRAWIAWGAMAACMVMMLGIGGIMQALKKPSAPPDSPDPPLSSPAVTQIDSLDTLNYFGGLLAIKKTQPQINPLEPTASASVSPTKAVSSLYTKQHTPVFSLLSHKTEPQYYDIEQITEYQVTKSIYFKLTVNEACPFLYGLFGDGTVEVVVTNNNIGTMITFQKSKAFYSCLYEYGDESTDVFTSAKYVDGEYVINDSTSNAVLFYIGYEYDSDPEQSVENVTFEWSAGDDGERTALSLIDLNVMSRSKTCHLSLQEIGEYYYSVYHQGLPNGELKYAFKGTVRNSSTPIYLHVFTSGEFYICDEKFLKDNDDPFAFYLRGMNSHIFDNEVLLQYTDENGKDIIIQCMRSWDGSFSYNNVAFTPYSITEEDAQELPLLYFACYNDNEEALYYLRANTDGTFIVGEPVYVDPYYDGRIEDKVKEGYWGINSEGTYFIYFVKNEKITVTNIDYENGEALPIFNHDYVLCDDPFPPDEVTDIRKTQDGIELQITRDRHYMIVDATGYVVEQGYLKYSIDKQSVSFYVQKPNGEINGFGAYISADASIMYSQYIFYPTKHLVFDPILTNEDVDIVLRFDIVSDTNKPLTLYIMRDNTFFVWDHRLADWIYGKGVAVFGNDGIQLRDYIGYDEKPNLFATFTDSSTQTEITLDGDIYRLVYDLR